MRVFLFQVLIRYKKQKRGEKAEIKKEETEKTMQDARNEQFIGSRVTFPCK